MTENHFAETILPEALEHSDLKERAACPDGGGGEDACLRQRVFALPAIALKIMQSGSLIKCQILTLLCVAIVLLTASCTTNTYVHVDHLSGPAHQPLAHRPAAPRLAAAVDPTTLRPTVERLASKEFAGRKTGSPGGAIARGFLIDRLRASGLKPAFEGGYVQVTRPDGEPFGHNVAAVHRAANADAEWIVLVAHYDHLGEHDGQIHAGADDNGSAVALLLALADALGREQPSLKRHVVILFPDAEEPPYIRTKHMGSWWFWKHPPLPIENLHLAVVMDLMGGRASEAQRKAGLGDALFIMGAEADQGLAHFAQSVAPEPGMERLFCSLASIETLPFVPWKRYSRSDYHGLREESDRPFLFLSTGRTETYHTARDTAETLDYERMERLSRYLARFLVHAADNDGAIGWADYRVDPVADARIIIRLHATLEEKNHPAMAWRALGRDLERAKRILRASEAGVAPSVRDYRSIQLALLRVQAAALYPSAAWIALW